MIGSAARSIGQPAQRTHKAFRYPAPVGGIDVRKSIGSEDLNFCAYTYNLTPFEYGLRVREGFREWQIGVDNGGNLGVHTLIPFDAASELGSGDKLFAVNNEGIWDVTIAAAAPVLMETFLDSSIAAGYGTYAHYVNDADIDILFYADSLNGLFIYDTVLDTWGPATGITGPVIEDIKFVVSHKQRLWMVEANSTNAWYLEVGSNNGLATEFFFGAKFRHGGTLEGLFNWTVDGGNGIDDMFVAVSHSGDVVVYAGSDPEAIDWEMRGTYYIGEIPATPRFGSEQGGELYLLSAYGVTSMNDLLRGVDSNVLQSNVEGTSLSFRIAGLIRGRMRTSISAAGWDVSTIPSQGGFLIEVPTVGSDAPIQFYYNHATLGWGIWRGVPMTCFDEFNGSVVFGTKDGRIMRMDVPVDNQLITPPPENLFNGEDIEFSILTAFSSLDNQAVYKTPHLVRPDFVSTLPPQHSTLIRYDYDTSEGVNFQLSDPSPTGASLWDVALWDAAIWASSEGQTFPTIGGTWGTGRYLAIATKGASRTDTRLVGWDLIYDVGGPML